MSKPIVPPEKSGVIKALQTFGSYQLGSAESTALYALRNSLVHDSSLAGRNKQGQWFFFRYDYSQLVAVKPALKPWNGVGADIKTDMVTWINPRKLTDEISDIYSSVRNLYSDRHSDLRVNLDGDKIISKFIFWSPK